MSVNPWTAYFAAQAELRDKAASKAADIERKYADMPLTVDVIEMMARMNRMYGEIATVNTECEAALAKVKKPEGAQV